MTSYKGYLEKGYSPGKDELVAEFFIEPNKISFEEAAQSVAAESSIGTWTELSTLTPEIQKKLTPRIFDADKKSGVIKIAYPSDLFEAGNVSQLLSSVAGNIFGMQTVKNIRLLDIAFHKSFVSKFKGPEFGISGIRKLTKLKERPLVGTIIKPKLGLNAKEHAKVGYNAWLGGCDIVKDDENLTSMTFNNFYERIEETLALRDRCEKETGEKKIYLANITAPYDEMVKRAEFVKERGGEYVMIDILTTGWSALQQLRDLDMKLYLHAHRAMHAAFTRNKKHGISMLVVTRLSRLIGLDNLHIGAIYGKMEGGKEEVMEYVDACRQEWHGFKKTIPVASGGLYPGVVDKLINTMGKDIVIQAGGGVHGHPKGTIAGAKAMRQAVDATLQGISLKQYGKIHFELGEALKKWK